MTQDNQAILEHQKDGKALRVFWGARGAVTYAGEFRLDAAKPWYADGAPEAGGGPIRKVIVSRSDG